MPRRSGRYPWGSGKDPYQHSGDFLSRVDELTKKGMSEKDIAESMGLTTSQLRTQKSLAKDERRQLEVDTAKGLREKGYSLNEIAKQMGYKNDSSVRSLLNEQSESRMKQAKQTADFLKKQVDYGLLNFLLLQNYIPFPRLSGYNPLLFQVCSEASLHGYQSFWHLRNNHSSRHYSGSFPGKEPVPDFP